MTELLVQRLARLKARLQPLNSRFGRPNFVTVVLEHPTGIFTVLGTAIEELRLNERELVNFQNTDIKVTTDTTWLTNIPRLPELPLAAIQEGKYIIDARRSPMSGNWTGRRADAAFVDTKNDTVYKVLVNRHRVNR